MNFATNLLDLMRQPDPMVELLRNARATDADLDRMDAAWTHRPRSNRDAARCYDATDETDGRGVDA